MSGKTAESVQVREKGTWTAVEPSRRKKGGGEKTRRRTSYRVKGKKSLQPVSERFVPGQSIKNVSRAEIIKVRISDRQQGAMRDEESRCMMQGRLVRVVIESGWGAGEGSAQRMFEIFPRPTRGSRWEIFIDSYPSAVARIWLRVNMISLLGSLRWLLACFVYLCGHVYTRTCRFSHCCGCVATRLTLFVENQEEKIARFFSRNKSLLL